MKQKIDIAIRILEEMGLNYKSQHPKEIPDMNLVVNIIVEEIKQEDEKLRMWDCVCGCIYDKDLDLCPVCKSKKRTRSRYKNFPPVKIDKNDIQTINWKVGY